MANILSLVAAAAVGACLALLATNYGGFVSHLLEPPSIPSTRDVLHTSKTITVTGAVGPESLVFDPNGGGPYVGVADGRILKWVDDTWVNFSFTSSNRTECTRPFAPELEHVCGRPLGLRFEKTTGNLYIADAYLGLCVVGPEGGQATPLISEVEGKRVLFTNDMDIDEEEDVIYFTDSSTQFYRREFLPAIYSIDQTGRFMKYDKARKTVTVLMKGLTFANGVALSRDKSFVLVAESTACKIRRFWLQGPKAGTSELFVELPGFPDNIRRNSKGEFWVALHCKKGVFDKFFLLHHWIGKAILKLPIGSPTLHSLLVGGKAHATAIKLSEDGKILDVLEDVDGRTLRFISEVEEKDGKLWIGSVLVPFIGVYDL